MSGDPAPATARLTFLPVSGTSTARCTPRCWILRDLSLEKLKCWRAGGTQTLGFPAAKPRPSMSPCRAAHAPPPTELRSQRQHLALKYKPTITDSQSVGKVSNTEDGAQMRKGRPRRRHGYYEETTRAKEQTYSSSPQRLGAHPATTKERNSVRKILKRSNFRI